MALTLYPADGWDTFIDVTSADAVIGNMFDSAGKTAYENLDPTGKEAILRQTALQIKLCPSIRLPETNEPDLGYAQCYLSIHALTTDMMSYDANNKAISSETVDVISVTYDVNKKGSNSDFDNMTSALLKQYGCSGKSSGFKQTFLGRS